MLFCDSITDAMTKGLGQQKACVRYNIITSAMDVILLFLLLPSYGMQGYLFSFFITHLLNFILSLRRLLKIAGNVITPSVPIFAVVSTASAIFISSHVHLPVIRAGAFIVIFGCLLFLLSVLGKEDVAWIKGLIKKR